eukprot:g3952.t1
MGGRSSGSLTFIPAAPAAAGASSPAPAFARFAGTIRVEGGGFATVRTAPATSYPASLRDYAGLELKVKTDGSDRKNRFKVCLKNDPNPRGGASYQQDFELPAGKPGTEWTTVRLPWAGFIASWRGRTVVDAPPVDPASIYSIGLRISKFKDTNEPDLAMETGDFALDVEYLGAYA